MFRERYRTATVRESVPTPIFSRTRKQGDVLKRNHLQIPGRLPEKFVQGIEARLFHIA
jgi:hypothetical protein